jgi:hypothetical protein
VALYFKAPPIVIIELVSLPGAGKTTIRNALTVAVATKGSVPLHALRPTPAFFKVFWQLMKLALGARPMRLNRLKRAFNAGILLRHYQPTPQPIVLDQGTVQKLWSILADAETYSPRHLDATVKALVPFAPDHLVWIETPLDLALERLAARVGGNSRYDGLTPEKARSLLAQRAGLLKALAERLSTGGNSQLLVLDGEQPARVNARTIEALLR